MTKINLSPTDSKALCSYISATFDKFNDARVQQLDDLRNVRNAIYSNGTKGTQQKHFRLPDIWELAQTLKAHLIENLYSNPEGMFDVSGANLESQRFANAQKATLVNYFEKMNVSDEIEKIVDSVIETGEATVLVGWETKHKKIRRPYKPTDEPELLAPSTLAEFTTEQKLVYDGPKITFIPPQDFVFDAERRANFNSAAKIYRTYATLAEITENKLNTMLCAESIDELQALTQEKRATTDLEQEPPQKGVKGELLEVLEFWGDIKIAGKLYKNMLAVVAGRKTVIRLEENPFVEQPFIHASIITDPRTGRGVSPLKVALGLTDVSSAILTKQMEALSLIINPPYLAPKGCFKGQQTVTPGKIIEYDAALMPNQPIPLNFSAALKGWDFINFFKATIEAATGIYKTMAGNLSTTGRTATEINYSASGQSARLNMFIDAISRKIIIPMVEKTAETLANFKFGAEKITTFKDGELRFVDISDEIRWGDYIYRYGDRKATIERKYRFKELFDVVVQFAQNREFGARINYEECFKFALEQFGIENPTGFLKSPVPQTA